MIQIEHCDGRPALSRGKHSRNIRCFLPASTGGLGPHTRRAVQGYIRSAEPRVDDNPPPPFSITVVMAFMERLANTQRTPAKSIRGHTNARRLSWTNSTVGSRQVPLMRLPL